MFISEVKSNLGEDISILIRKDNHSWNYLCECGEASELTVKEIQQIRAIFISHTHIDHFVNFDTIVRHQIGIERTVVVCGPKGISDQVASRLRGYTWNLVAENAIKYQIREILEEGQVKTYEVIPPYWRLKEIEMDSEDKIYENEAFAVSYTLLDHKTPSVAYRFTEQDRVKISLDTCSFKGGVWVGELKTAFANNDVDREIDVEGTLYKAEELFSLLCLQKGDSLGVIMDHAANERNHHKINKLFKNCNTVFIESFYKNEDKELAVLNYHSYARKSGEIMKKAEVEKAIPVHFSRKYKEKDLKALEKEFYAAWKEGG
ncbi:peptidase [Aquimarina hainanensis]|uniref:Peptidase n=1 Tax=Aquimarina hainanensis TaxID=1578017 RepID=A0ABW5N7N1_9FLAO